MGSSGGDDYSVPPQQPAPPASMVSPKDPGWQGMNFLGSGTTTVADIDRMQPQFAAMSAPPVAAGGAGDAAAGNPAAPGGGEPMSRDVLTALLAKQGMRPGTYSIMQPGQTPPDAAFMGQGNRSDWGGSGGRGRGPY